MSYRNEFAAILCLYQKNCGSHLLSFILFVCVGYTAQVYMGRDVLSGKVVERLL
jgi:hypothetical protein